MKVKFTLGFVIIFAITLFAYFPSFWHLFRGETYIYFLNTQGDNSFWSLLSHTYNYEKVRVFEAGDTLLFRPLLFTFIGAEKSLFGVNHVGWHITAFLTHMLATFCLFRLLWKIRAGILAVLLAILFSTMYILVNSVLYEQVVPYMLFTALFLTALYYIDNKPIVSLACMLPACFIHEIGLAFVGLMAVYLWLKGQKRWALALPSLIALYIIIYIPQKFINPSPLMGSDMGTLISLQNIPIGVSSAFTLVGTWFSQIVFPSLFTLKPLPELAYYPAQIENVSMTAISVILGMVSFVVFIAIFIPLLSGLVANFKKQGWRSNDNLFALLVGCMFLAFVVSVSFFRAGHGTGYMVNHNFGAYIALSCALVLVYSLKKNMLTERYYKALLIGAVSLFILSSAPKTFMLNYEVLNQQKHIQPQWFDIKTFKGSPSNPEYYYFTVPEILEGVK